jgi:single-stranded-DNA-specific exonuclease
MSLDYLIELNERRKQDQLKIYQESKLQIDKKDEVIIVASKEWNEGIVGIVASKLCERYKKPAIVFSIKGDISKASARSTSSINLYNLIDSCKDLLIGYGGHKQAAGLSIETEKLDRFKNKINKNIENIEKDIVKVENLLGELSLEDVDHILYDMIESFRPFGEQNRYPLFSFFNLKILSITKMGKNKEFTKLIVSDTLVNKEVVIFVDFDNHKVGDNISFLATISKNEFRGDIKYNLMFKELL